MITLNVRGLPRETTERSLTELFGKFGKVHKLKMAIDPFKNECKGFAELAMEGHEARAAIAGLDGSFQEGGALRVSLASDRPQRGRR
ncbi:RNA recognition motif domain-containing protein [Dokdonella sp. MW10]|uniref:RNA recognition motif domain-containing protein n=1 Tax=Dokdonella sp. MW10 TaxID=2992926 RepID=UPI003F8168DF